MFRHGEISTETDRRPFVFTLIALIGSIAAAVLLFALCGSEPLAIFAGILFAVVGAAAGAVLFAMLTDYAYIDNGRLHTRYLFKRASIPFEDIGRVTCVDKMHYVFGKKDEKLAVINGKLTGIGKVLYQLEKNGVRFE